MTDTALPLSPPERPGLPGRVLAWRQRWLGMDRNEAALSFAMSVPGIVLLHIAVFTVFALTQPGISSLAVTALGLAGCAVFPQRRALFVGLTTLAFLFVRPHRAPEIKAFMDETVAGIGLSGIDARLFVVAAVALFLFAAYAGLRLQSRYRPTRPAQRPLVSLLVLFFALTALALIGILPVSLNALLWMVLAVFASTFWALAYAFADQKQKDTLPVSTRLGFLRPYWGGSAVPIGKGAGFLGKFEAKDERALAATRLKALKLIVWGALLTGCHAVLTELLHERAGLPTLIEAIAAKANGTLLPIHMDWAVLVAHYLLGLLFIAAWSHVVVALVRMAGYGIPRNTINPLAARTLADFWNRYYYYFKELLVDFFFFPVFLRWFKKSPKLRVAFATFCAAGVGNFLFHFVERVDLIAGRGLVGALVAFESYALYVIVLSVGLILSQVRNRRPQPEQGFLRYQVLPRLHVGLFFCLLAIFDGHEHLFTFGERLSFLAGLFGVTP